MPTLTQETTVAATRLLTPDVRELELNAPAERLHFHPGQWVSLHLPLGERPPLVRAYTLARPEDPSGRLTLCFDRVEDGLGSNYLFELQPGDPITLGGVLGHFALPEPWENDLLFVAHYTGIVPFRCMLLSLRDKPLPHRIRLVYGALRSNDLIYHDEFESFARCDPRFEYRPTLLEPDPTWTRASGTELELLEQHAAAWMPSLPMVCGIRGFTRPVREFFHSLGFERRAVRFENYD